jgi:ribosomal protein L12E/L44/L45/RPP1/RPP2
MAAIIGALRVVLGADTATFEKGLKNADKKAGDFGKNLAKAAAVVGAAVVGMATAIGIGVKSAIDEADNLTKMAQSIGIPVDELTRLKHAADLSGVSMQGLQSSVARMSRALAEVTQSTSGPAAQAFATLGIAVKNSDGTLKSASQVIAEVSGKFAGMADGSTKTALAMSIFGRAGAQMIPMLNAGSDGLRKMMQEADQLGLVFDEKAGKAAEAFNDNLTRLGRVKDGIITQLTVRMLPALQTLTDWLVEGAKSSGMIQSAAETLARVFEGLARGIIFVYDNAGTLVRVFAVFVGMQLASTVATIAIAFVKFAAAIRLTTIAGTLLNVVKLMMSRSFLFLAGAVALVSGQMEVLKGVIASLAETVQGLMEKFAPESMETVVKGLNDLGLDINALTADFSNLAPSVDASTAALTKFTPKLVNTTAATKAAAEAEKEHNKLIREGKRVTEETQTPHEQLAARLERLKFLLDEGAITWQTYERATEQASRNAGLAWDVAGQSIASSIERAAGTFGKESRTMAMIAKTAGIVQATISMFTGAAKALELPFPANIGAWATVLATGASMVSSIRSVSVPSFQTGGSFRVGGGMGGGDTRMVPIMAEPGEIVDIKRPDQQRRSSTLEIKGLGLDDLFNGRQVRSLMERMSEEIGDGARLRFA